MQFPPQYFSKLLESVQDTSYRIPDETLSIINDLADKKRSGNLQPGARISLLGTSHFYVHSFKLLFIDPFQWMITGKMNGLRKCCPNSMKNPRNSQPREVFLLLNLMNFYSKPSFHPQIFSKLQRKIKTCNFLKCMNLVRSVKCQHPHMNVTELPLPLAATAGITI